MALFWRIISVGFIFANHVTDGTTSTPVVFTSKFQNSQHLWMNGTSLKKTHQDLIRRKLKHADLCLFH